MCYIVSGVPRYANNHATTSGMHYIVPYAAISYAVKMKGLTGQRLSKEQCLLEAFTGKYSKSL